MNDATDNENNATGAAEDTDKSGKSGRGKVGSGGGGGIRLPPDKLKEVTGNWEYLDVTKVAARMADFFSELPARASAQMQVSWAELQGAGKEGFAIVTEILKYGQEISRLMHNLTRENVEILQVRYGLNVSGPSG